MTANHPPIQPGDDILKGHQTWLDSMKQLEHDLRHPPRDDEESDFQPYAALFDASDTRSKRIGLA